MSLVVCANAERDNTESRINGGLNNAWSFRNTLSSTYKIPENAQVALQSCKVNIDGRVVVSRDNANFYHYFGQKLNTDGSTAPQFEDTTSMPVFSTLLDDTEQGQVLELSKSDVAKLMQSSIRRTSFHPNTKELATVALLKNASDLDFLGYSVAFDQSDRSSASIPTTMEDWYGAGQISNGSGKWTYAANTLTRSATSDDSDIVAVIGTQFPISTQNKELLVSLDTANSSGVEWHVGLSRFVNFENDITSKYQPYYFDENYSDVLDISQDCFMDFAVARNYNDELICYHSTYDSDNDITKMTEVEYWDNTNGSFSSLSARKNLSGTNYTQVKLVVHGERVAARILNKSTGVWETITEYGASIAKTDMFKPVNQSCWCLHPVLCIGRNASATKCSMSFQTYNGMNITGYNPKTLFKGGWYESMELLGTPAQQCYELEGRTWNDVDSSVAYAQYSSNNASSGIPYDNVLVLQENNIYLPSANANAKNLFGFEKSIVDTPAFKVGSLLTFNSTTVPTTANLLSMFVRLDNMGQSVVNALTGNDSKIIAHLTSVETAVGRRTYEPSSLIFIDLNNPAELNISDFNLSFCYANEQYSTILQGQSIVCLYFRPKPKMLM